MRSSAPSKPQLRKLDIAAKLREAGLRPTRQRVALGKLLFSAGPRHVTAESLHEEAETSGAALSLATVYNTLHQFKQAGLLRQVNVDGGKSYFDTNMQAHHHFYFEREGLLVDIDGDGVKILGLPSAPAGLKIDSVEVVVRLKA